MTLGDVLMDEGRNADAEPLLRDALNLKRRTLGEDNTQVAELLDEVGQVRWAEGDMPQAERFYFESLRIYTRLLGPDSKYVGELQNNLSVAYSSEGKLPECVAMGKQAVATYRRAFGDSHPELLTLMGNLITNVHEQGDHIGEVALVRDIEHVASRIPTLGLDQRQKLHMARYNVAYDRGDYREAEQGEREEMERYRAGGSARRFIAATFVELGNSLAGQGRHAESEQAYRSALTQLQGVDANGLRAARDWERLGRELLVEGKDAEAREVVDKAISIMHAKSGPQYIGLGSALLDLGELNLRSHRNADAEKDLEQALAIRKRSMVSGAWEITVVESALARARGDAAAIQAVLPALTRCAASSYECGLEAGRVKQWSH
jgi:tetratricopeptide (TPR) repeat protein